MVILASGIARGHVRTTDDDDDDGGVAQHGGHTPKEAYSLSLRCTFLILDIPTMINWHLSKQAIR